MNPQNYLVGPNNMEALADMFASVMKANFTEDEIALLGRANISPASISNSGRVASVSRGDGQKTCIALMTRWPLDDSEDFMIAAARAAGNLMTPRSALGKTADDNALKQLLGGFADGVINAAVSLVGTVVNASTRRQLKMPGTLDTEWKDSVPDEEIDMVDPKVTFADSRAFPLFKKFFLEV